MTDDTILVRGQQQHAVIPAALIQAVIARTIPHGALAFYALLDWHRDRRSKRTRVGLRGLSASLGPSIPTLLKWRDALVRIGLLIIEVPKNPREPHIYHLRWAPCPKPPTYSGTRERNLHTRCSCESSCATFEAMGRSACTRAGFTVPSSSEIQAHQGDPPLPRCKICGGIRTRSADGTRTCNGIPCPGHRP